MADNSAVVAACQAHWEAHKADCSGFARAVATALGVPLTGMANDIVDELQKEPWTITMDGNEAAAKAQAGYFVLGGLKEDPHGHVVVVVGPPFAHDKYPSAYWGRLGAVGAENQTINWSWNAEDRDKVIYGYRSFGAEE
jgi:hypothetical protein